VRRDVAAIVIGLLWCGVAAAEPPAVTSVMPSAVTPGRTVDVTLRGSGLDTPVTLWTSFPAEARLADCANDHAAYSLNVPAEVPVGVGALRVATKSGVSGLVPVFVDDLPTTGGHGGGHSASSATEIVPPVAVDGACEPLESDFYQFGGKRGQRVSVEVVAARMGSPLDPVVRLLDASGRELAWADDSPGAGGDCRLAVTLPDDGRYLVEVRDTAFEGGPGHRYRLRLGDFPLAAVAFPLGGKRGTAGLFALLGDGCDEAAPVMALVPPEARRVGLSGRRQGGAGSGFASIVASDLDETIESEPNDSPATATPLVWPAAVNGRLQTPGDVDYYKLALRKGERVSFATATRTAGSPCDLAMRLLRKGGATVARSKPDTPADAALDAFAPEDGTYWLRVEEIARAGGLALAYRIEVVRFHAGFTLAAETDTVNADAGGEFQLKVTCTRRDFTGPISLALVGLTPVALEGATIPPGKQEAQLTVKLPPGLQGGRVVPLRVVGSAMIDGTDLYATASTAAVLRKQFPRMLYTPQDLDGVIALGVRDPR
jgi:hypothetical protein